MILDADHIGMLRALGEEVLAEVIAVYLATTPDNLRAISAAILASDLVLLRREAHSLKGASGNVGAVALSQACKGLEHAAADGHLEEIPGAWATLQARYVEAREALQELA